MCNYLYRRVCKLRSCEAYFLTVCSKGTGFIYKSYYFLHCHEYVHNVSIGDHIYDKIIYNLSSHMKNVYIDEREIDSPFDVQT